MLRLTMYSYYLGHSTFLVRPKERTNSNIHMSWLSPGSPKLAEYDWKYMTVEMANPDPELKLIVPLGPILS